MKRLIFTLLLFASSVAGAKAQTTYKKVENVEVLDLYGKPAVLPEFGKKNLMIFYVDPDRARQNHEFTVELEENKLAEGENLLGFGVMNLKDAPMIPNGLARMMARARTKKNKALILSDQDRVISREWDLGDCNNNFIIMLINREGEILFMSRGELTEEEKTEFYRVLKDLV
ncbi:MAG: hypothetical protein SNH88_06990 [Rikenellaceae bacterium]